MTLDELYSPGAASAVCAALDLTSILPWSVFDFFEEPVGGGVGTRATYSVGGEEAAMLTIQWCPTFAFYSLSVEPNWRGKGIYRQTVCAQSALLAHLGVEALVAIPADERAEYLLALGGFHWQDLDGERKFCTLAVGDRAQEYREWVAAGRPEEAEPTWHAQLAAKPVFGVAVY